MPHGTVETETGKLRGLPADANGVHTWLGVPYAAPPTGPLRWHPPQPAVAWSGTRDCTSLGTNAPQRMLFPDIDAFSAGQSEDCLFLNIWSPHAKGSAGKSPVLFYIHGGGFAVGFGGEPRYFGANLAKRGLVVVTVNYRLNALGLLAHPALSAEQGASGNYAMLDLVQALHWVKRNIANFGGDADQVTIAGESAGSMFVSMLMASPLSRDLFHRAIGESGAQFQTPERPMLNLREAEQQGLDFAKKLKATTAADLRNLSVEQILDANPGLGFWPIVDGHFLPEKPSAIFAKGKQADVPLLAGWNKDEGMNFNLMKWPLAKKGYTAVVEHLFGAEATQVLKLYPAGKHEEASARELGADLTINHGTWAWLEAHRKTATADIFRYRFDHGPVTTWFPDEPVQGAFHSCEIPYVMDNVDAFDWTLNDNDHAVAALTSSYVVNFVKTANPNGNSLPVWPSYRGDTRPMLLIDVKPSIAHDVDRDRHHMLAQV